MIRQCPKCGFEKPDASYAVNEECPKCGVIYAKAAEVSARQRQVASVRSRVEATETHQTSASPLERLAWIVTFLGGVLGLWQLAHTTMNAASAPQQAAGAAMAIGWAAIPYCIARAIQLFSR